MRSRSLAGFCAALLPPEAGGPDPVQLAARVASYAGRLPQPARAGLFVGAAALDGVAVATSGHRLAAMTPARRARVLDLVARPRVGADAVEALKALVLLVAGADLAAGDIAARSARDEPAPDGRLDVTPAPWWPTTSRFDAIVVGSGAGGAMAARTLAREGLDVLVVEEGRRFVVEEFRTGHPLDRFASLYRDGGATAALGVPPVAMPIGRGVGGSTLVNSGTCYRTPDDVLRRWRDDAGLALADVDRFGRHLDEVERLLAVTAVAAEVMGRNGRLLLAGAEALGWESGPLLRNAPDCGGCCQCSIGCPRNAKLGVHLTALPDACGAGARILSEAKVERVVHERGRAVGIVARRADGSRLSVQAPRVVVAAGTTETPTLLRRSRLGRHPRLGRNLAVHPALAAAGRFDEPVVAWQGVLQSAAVDHFRERDGILVEATSTPPGMGSMVLPGHGEPLLADLAAADHLATLGAMVGDEPVGRVIGGRRTVIRYDLSRRDGARLVQALGIMGRLLFAAGAREVLTGVAAHPGVTSVAGLDEALADADPRRLHLAAFHPTGTAAAGADPERHPVDGRGRLRGVDGVWVADGSVLPSCPEVNPQISIMAMAQAIAEEVVRTPTTGGPA